MNDEQPINGMLDRFFIVGFHFLILGDRDNSRDHYIMVSDPDGIATAPLECVRSVAWQSLPILERSAEMPSEGWTGECRKRRSLQENQEQVDGLLKQRGTQPPRNGLVHFDSFPVLERRHVPERHV
jgi:hypothetical protein